MEDTEKTKEEIKKIMNETFTSVHCYKMENYDPSEFYDYNTKQSIAVVKSKAIGWTVSHDQKIAYKAIKKQLDKTFK